MAIWNTLKKNYGILLQLATWMFSMLSPFILIPAGLDPVTDDPFWTKFSQAVLALLIGLLWVPAHFFNKKKYLWYWWGIACFSTILGVSMVFRYKDARDLRTIDIEWRGKTVKVIKGSVYTSEAFQYKQQEERRVGHPLKDIDLIRQFAVLPKDFNQIWTEQSIRSNNWNVDLYYTSTIIIFSISIILVIQAIKILQS